MDGEQIAKLRLANPFRPFTMVTRDGRRLSVGQPYTVAVTVDRRRLIYELPDGDYVALTSASIASVEVDHGGQRGDDQTVGRSQTA